MTTDKQFENSMKNALVTIFITARVRMWVGWTLFLVGFILGVALV